MYEDHSESGSYLTQYMNDFNECVNEIGMEDLHSYGMHFTWTKSLLDPSTSTLKKIDRIMVNGKFIEDICRANVVFLPHGISDHSPAMLNCPDIMPKKRGSFRFVNYTTKKDGFVDIVKEVLEEYYEVIKDEESLLFQKAKVQWMSKGDRNTTYFHKVLKGRVHRSRVKSISGEDGVRYEGDNVARQFVRHFEDFLGKKDIVLPLDSFKNISKNKIPNHIRDSLIFEVTEKEIKDYLYGIDDNKAPGPDGFTAKFFKKSWDIVGIDVCLAVKEFFVKGKLLRGINATLITLALKIQTSSKVSDFRPISRCNVFYKIMSKVLNNINKYVLDLLVNKNQSAFKPGRQIIDNILLSQEMLKGYDCVNGPRRCALKIDAQKACGISMYEDHSEGGSYLTQYMNDFNECVNEIGMEDLHSYGMHFTWTKSLLDPSTSTLKKIDRIMVNGKFIEDICRANVVFLPHGISDHSPAMLNGHDIMPKKRRSFRFVNYTTKKDGFVDIVKEGNLFDKVNSLKDKLDAIQIAVDKDLHYSLLRNESVNVFEEYYEVIKDEENLLFQKAKVEWMSKGDRNTTYFYKVLKGRVHRSRVKSINSEDGVRYEGDNVAKQFVRHFEDFLGKKDIVLPLDSFKNIFKNKIPNHIRDSLIFEVTEKEIKDYLYGIDDNKSPGPDGFTAKFFKKSWDIVGIDVCLAVKEFFVKGKLLGGIWHSKLVLLEDSLAYFGFPKKMIEWIMLCVSTPSYDIYINGVSKDFKYHSGCNGINLAHLVFVDDLLVLFHGSISYVKVIKGALEKFSSVSGLHPNLGKSTIFYGSIPVEV
ncbi:RNA-directed DNA polymerase, eukaryota, reverse transcriptase zinc-binding domain protein [Tanacetum coccineum]